MFGAIRRVISGEDIEETHKQDLSPDQFDALTPNAFRVPAIPISRMQDSPSPAALIETEDINDKIICNHERSNTNNNTMDVDVHRDGDNSTAGSSLSDVSTAKEPSFPHHFSTIAGPQPMRMVVEEPPQPLIPPSGLASIPQSKLARNDSRNSNDSYSSYGRQSSQNSSRDWGWFEDVHTTGLDHPANSGGSGSALASASGNLKRGKDHSNFSSSNEENNKKKGKRGASSNNDGNNGYYFHSNGGRGQGRAGKSGGGSPLLPNLGLLLNGGEYGGGDGLYRFQPLEPLIHHPSTAMDMESGECTPTTHSIVLQRSRAAMAFVFLSWKESVNHQVAKVLSFVLFGFKDPVVTLARVEVG
jgi:hypothetical protein